MELGWWWEFTQSQNESLSPQGGEPLWGQGLGEASQLGGDTGWDIEDGV